MDFLLISMFFCDSWRGVFGGVTRKFGGCILLHLGIDFGDIKYFLQHSDGGVSRNYGGGGIFLFQFISNLGLTSFCIIALVALFSQSGTLLGSGWYTGIT